MAVIFFAGDERYRRADNRNKDKRERGGSIVK